MNSSELFARAQRVIPGGVNSPVRAFGSVHGEPPYMKAGSGAYLMTEDDRTLTDYCCSWGPLILGHARAEVVRAVQKAVAGGTSFGANTRREVEFAELLCGLIPYVDKVRLVNSGTEAVMTALRLARGYTGRRRVVKFDGCYHGHTDYMLVSAGSGLLTGGETSSAGVSDAATEEVFVAPFNDAGAVDEIVDEYGDEIAAIIVEPVAGNMGLVPPADGFLESLRAAATRSGALLVFDEVITGFRLGPTTFGDLCGVEPDLTTLGKIIGGGMPIGAVGGRAEIMDTLAPLGPVYQAGTLSGNPVAVAAGLATLQTLQAELPYDALAELCARLVDGVNAAAERHGIEMHCAHLGSMFTPFFRRGEVSDLASARECDTDAHAAFHRAMLDSDIYLPPSQFELCFLSSAHADADVDAFVDAAERHFASLEG